MTTDDQAPRALPGIEFTALAAVLAGAATVAELLQRVVDAGAGIVQGADLVSVTVREPDGSYATPVSTAPLAERLDVLQYRLGTGPCVKAVVRDRPAVVESADLEHDEHLQPWGRAAVEEGVRSALAVSLSPVAAAPRSAALNFFSFRPHGLDRADREAAVILAAHACLALEAAGPVRAAELEAAQLREALQTRDVIGQAKGVLMEREGVDADTAFGLLRSASQRLNLKLAEVARTVVTRRGDL